MLQQEPIDVLPAYAPPVVAEVLPVQTPQRRRVPSVPDDLKAAASLIGGVLDNILGAITLIAALAALAVIPVLQFLSLGYLLEAGGRIARTGRIRDGFIGLRIAARAGTIIAGTWLMLLPLRFISSMATDAQLIDPGGSIAHGWKLALTLCTIAMVIHIAFAIACGGRLHNFFLPFINPVILGYRVWQGGYYARARDAVWDYVMSLRLPYYFWIGLRGFAGGFVWLVLPVTMLALGRIAPLVGFAGGACLVIVLLFLPFLQINQIARNRFITILDFPRVALLYSRAPIAFAVAFIAMLLLAIPLYLLKIELVPRELAWIPSVFFIISIFPARVLTGWAFARAERKIPRHVVLRIFAMLVGLPIMFATSIFYVIILFFSQYTSWGGVWSLYQQHAFLLPVPFLGM
jgi:hypothetical protein